MTEDEMVLCIRWPKYWSFSFNISPSNEYSGVISFRIDWLDLLAVQGTLKSLLQHQSSKSIYTSALSLLYGPPLTSIHDYCKTHRFDYMGFCQQSDSLLFNMLSRVVIALTRWTFIGKVMSLLFDMLSSLVMYGCESWTIKKVERQRIDAFELWCWRRLLRVPWTARRSNQSILKEITPEYSLEGVMLKLKCQYFGHLLGRTGSLEKALMLGKIEGGRRRG